MTHLVPQPIAHPMMPLPTHDAHAREDFIVELKLHMMEHAYPYDELVYEQRAKPKFIKEHGRPPENCDEVHTLMMDDTFTQMWSGIARNLQEMLWANEGEIAAQELPRLSPEARERSAKPLGTLTLDPKFKMPRYVDAVDIHCMPVGYQTSLETMICLSALCTNVVPITTPRGREVACAMALVNPLSLLFNASSPISN